MYSIIFEKKILEKTKIYIEVAVQNYCYFNRYKMNIGILIMKSQTDSKGNAF